MFQELIECAAGLSVRPEAVSQLQDAMAKLASVSADVESSLSEIQAMLQEEKANEKEYQQIVGPRPATIMSELEREAQKYKEAHSMATESNLTLHKAMQLHVKNLKLLARPLMDIQREVPTLTDLGEDAEVNIGEMRKIISKVDEMKSQRVKLMNDLRTAVQEDDITSSLAQKGDRVDKEVLFRDEIKKHDKMVSIMRQNIAAQANILNALTEKNAEYVDTRQKVTEVMRRREDMIGSLVASYHAYEDLLNKTTKGLEFYDKLEGNVTKLLARVGGVVKVQQDERGAMMTSSAKKVEEARALSFSLISGGAGAAAGFRHDFTPGAPPPDTPEQQHLPPIGLPSTTASTSVSSRPKLGDYLRARKEAGLDPVKAGGNLGASKQDDKIPSVRPPPVGKESDPPSSVHSFPTGYDALPFDPTSYHFGATAGRQPTAAEQLKYPLPVQGSISSIRGQHRQQPINTYPPLPQLYPAMNSGPAPLPASYLQSQLGQIIVGPAQYPSSSVHATAYPPQPSLRPSASAYPSELTVTSQTPRSLKFVIVY